MNIRKPTLHDFTPKAALRSPTAVSQSVPVVSAPTTITAFLVHQDST